MHETHFLFGKLNLALMVVLLFHTHALGQTKTVAPAGTCWQYSPLYCQNKVIKVCDGKVCDVCMNEGSFCQDLFETDDNTYSELITSVATADVGFKNFSRPVSSQVRCGVKNSCRCTFVEFNESGNAVFKCKTKFYDGGNWMFSNAVLDTPCPATAPPGDSGGGNDNSAPGA